MYSGRFCRSVFLRERRYLPKSFRRFDLYRQGHDRPAHDAPRAERQDRRQPRALSRPARRQLPAHGLFDRHHAHRRLSVVGAFVFQETGEMDARRYPAHPVSLSQNPRPQRRALSKPFKPDCKIQDRRQSPARADVGRDFSGHCGLLYLHECAGGGRSRLRPGRSGRADASEYRRAVPEFYQ